MNATYERSVERAQRPWLRALASRNTGIVNAVLIGASTAAGHNATPRTRKFWNLLGEAYHAAYNPVGIKGGFHSLLSELSSWSFLGTTTSVRKGLGTSSITFSAGASGLYTVQSTTGFIVYYAQGPGQGAFKVKVDNGVPVTVTPDTIGVYRHDGKFTTQTLIRGEHTIQIIATGTVDINTVYVLDQDHTTGVRFYDAALGGNTSGDFLKATYSPTHWQQLGALAPKMVAICVGSNDHNDGVTVAQYKANIEAILAQIQTTLGYKPWVPLIAQQPRTLDFVAPVATWAEFSAALAQVAAALAQVAAANPDWVGFHDFGALFPQTAADGDGGGILSSDGAHPTTLGHEVAFLELAVPARTAAAVAPPAGTPVTPEVTSTVTPLTITSGLLARFSAKSFADRSIADGTAISEWPVEQGSMLVPMQQATSTRRPVYRATGAPGSKPAVEFDAPQTQSLAALWASAYDTPLTIFCVLKPPSSPAASQTVMGCGSSARWVALQVTNDNRYSLLPGQTSGVLRTSPSVVTAALHVIGGKFDGAAFTLHVDKQGATNTGTMATTAEQPIAGLADISVGRSSSSATSGNFTGMVSEIIVYNRALSSGEISTLMAELGTAYGVTIVA
ncbi:GDSL-type esterase/lipase family protein [Rhodococcus sp. NPDC127530]|uniref:GDSL-type esterase/lipase family protein n=1 Tax=unclassified Rhodococcus (in: high G+C Gram-positive bacteria) TaxID=192944 RepID=UPI0036358272